MLSLLLIPDTLNAITKEFAQQGDFITVFYIFKEVWFWVATLLVSLALFVIRSFVSTPKDFPDPRSTTGETVSVQTLPDLKIRAKVIKWNTFDKILRLIITSLVIIAERGMRGEKVWLNSAINYSGVIEVCFTFLMILAIYNYGGNSVVEWLINKALSILSAGGIIKKDDSSITEEEYKQLVKSNPQPKSNV